MKRVRVLVSIASADWGFRGGDVVEVGGTDMVSFTSMPAAEAALWVERGWAEPVLDQPKVEAAAMGAAETATLKAPRKRRGE